MKSTHTINRKFFALRSPSAALLCAGAALLMQGCATQQNAGYVAAATAQERMDAENAAQPKPNFENQPTYVKLVEQMQQNGMWFASLAHIDALEQRWGVSPESMRLRADALRNSGQAAESAVFYQRLTGTPLEVFGQHGLGLLAGGRGDFTEAVRLLEQARRMRPADAVLLSDLGYAQMRAGKLPQARVPLMQAYQLKPDNRQAQINLALYLEASGDAASATGLMDTQRLPEATRAAIRNAARELNPALPALPALPAVAVSAPASLAVTAVNTPLAPPPTALAGPSAAPLPPSYPDNGTQPLALKVSPWSQLSRLDTVADPVVVGATSAPLAAPR